MTPSLPRRLHLARRIAEIVAGSEPVERFFPELAGAFAELAGAANARIALAKGTSRRTAVRRGAGFAVPIRWGTAHLGAIEFEGADLDGDADERLVLLEGASLQLAARLDRDATLRDSEALARLAFVDGLTGVANRRAFDAALVREWSNAARRQIPLSLVMIDIDYFKLYNDACGHQAGDRALTAVAHALKSPMKRPGDILARYGGEEFVALFSGTSAKRAVDLAERMRAAVSELAIANPASSLGRTSISAGVATRIPMGGDWPEALLHAADDALYRAKVNGRNRVCGEAHESATAPVKPVRAGRTDHLPLQLTRLIGRHSELDDASSLLEEGRAVTIVGTGGSGKTRFAVEMAMRLAPQFDGGAHLADLSTITHADAIARTIAALVLPGALGERATADSLADAIGDALLLLVLDNCEHLVASTASVAETLLHRCPNLRLLSTSREPLGIPGEIVYRLPLLALPPADSDSAAEAREYESVELFVDRAAAARRSFELSDANVRDVVAICRSMDGIALAIEIAASHVGAIELHDLTRGALERAQAPTGERASRRQRTMDAAVDWSYELCTQDERWTFRRLAIFPGTFSLAEAAEICADARSDGHALERVVALVRKSLVANAGGERYALHQPVRRYALERLEQSGDYERVAALHARVFARAAERAYDSVLTLGLNRWLEEVAPDLENFRAAIAWALDQGRDRALGAAMIGNLGTLWTAAGLPAEGLRRADDALAGSEDNARLWLARSALLIAMWTLPDEQLAAAERAEALFEASGDVRGRVEASIYRGRALAFLRRPEESHAAFETAAAIARESDLPRLRRFVIFGAAVAAAQCDDFARAKNLYHELRLLLHDDGERRTESIAMMNLAEVEFALGNRELALSIAYRALELGSERINEAALKGNMVAYLVSLDRFDDARELGREALREMRVGEDRVRVAFLLQHLAAIDAVAGDAERAAQVLGFVDATMAKHRIVREFTERYTHERLLRALRGRMSEGEISELAAAGTAQTESAVVGRSLAAG